MCTFYTQSVHILDICLIKCVLYKKYIKMIINFLCLYLFVNYINNYKMMTNKFFKNKKKCKFEVNNCCCCL